MNIGVAIWVIWELTCAAFCLWNVRTAIRCLAAEEERLDPCKRTMKFVAVSIPMMLFLCFMLVKTGIGHIGMGHLDHVTMMEWLWTIADTNTVIWTYYGLKLGGDC